MEVDGVCDEFLKMEVDPQPGPSTATARASSQHSRIRVSYFFDDTACVKYYGKNHPMKPHRIRLAHDLVLAYGLHNKMMIYRPHRATAEQMTEFHKEDYIWYLRHVDPVNKGSEEHTKLMKTCEILDDCPIFEGLYEFCQLTSGASICGAAKLNTRESDIVINWSGGLHHAKKDKPSGFCYVNDIVLAILELLKYHTRVLYVDIDIHHGDGVEEAFLTTDRVMTVSFHKYGDKFFPGTGKLDHIGVGSGKYYSLNVPLLDGMDDKSYTDIFTTIMSRVMESYRPEAIVLQCGADSLSGDRLGNFNLSVSGHGNCVSFLKKYNLPLLLLGGGGYTIKNVARLWAYETSLAVGVDIPNKIPYIDEHSYYFPRKCKLHYAVERNVYNQNTKKYLQEIKKKVLENLKHLPFAPSVEMLEAPGPSGFARAPVTSGGQDRSRGRGRNIGRGNGNGRGRGRGRGSSRRTAQSQPSSRSRSGMQTRQSASKDE